MFWGLDLKEGTEGARLKIQTPKRPRNPSSYTTLFGLEIEIAPNKLYFSSPGHWLYVTSLYAKIVPIS